VRKLCEPAFPGALRLAAARLLRPLQSLRREERAKSAPADICAMLSVPARTRMPRPAVFVQPGSIASRLQAVANTGTSPTRIFLNPSRAQPGESVAVNQILPGQEFICRQHVAAAGFLGRQEPAADRCNDFGLATNDPALRIGMREICYSQRTTVRPLDGPRWAMVSGHVSRALQIFL
jgi:hypothetical protein